jgi:tetratricopeptide (TPR) repeat protein
MGRMSIAAQRPKSLRAARQFLPAALIVGAALLAYAPVFRAGFVWDDNNFLAANRLIRAWNGLYRIWFTRAPSDYFPLTSSLFWLEWRLWGRNATGYHALNLLLHAASAVLLWRVLLKLRVPEAWLGGLLFGLHPVAAASAAWISEGKNTLSMVFCLGSLLAWTRGQNAEGRTQNEVTQNAERRTQNAEQEADRAPRLLRSALCALRSAFCAPYYLLSLGLFLLALLAKTSVVMLPVILLLLAWWRRGKTSASDLFRTVPFFALSLALGLVTIWFQQHNAIGQEVVRAEGAASRVAAAGWIGWFYLYKILLPAGLCAVYPRWGVDGSRALSFLPLALLGAATALLWAGRKRWGVGPPVAWGCFLISLLPVMGFMNMSFMRLSLVADHLGYVGMPAILALAAAVLGRATARAPARAFVALCVAALAALTFERAGIFSSNERLWRDNLAKTPRSARIWCELGMAHFNAGALDEAAAGFDHSLALDPKYFEAWLDRGNVQMALHRYAEAIGDYDQALALRRDDAGAWYSRGVALGRIGRPEEALRDLDKALTLRPDFAEAYVSRGKLRQAAGGYEEALSDYERAVALTPDDPEARFNRGTAYARTGRVQQALSDLDEAIALKPDYTGAYVNRGNVYLSEWRYDRAIADYSSAIACNPRYAEAWYDRANAELAADRPAEAVRDLDRLIELRPREAGAYYQRALAHRRLKQDCEALADLERARQLGATVPEDLLRSLPPVK